MRRLFIFLLLVLGVSSSAQASALFGVRFDGALAVTYCCSGGAFFGAQYAQEFGRFGLRGRLASLIIAFWPALDAYYRQPIGPDSSVYVGGGFGVPILLFPSVVTSTPVASPPPDGLAPTPPPAPPGGPQVVFEGHVFLGFEFALSNTASIYLEAGPSVGFNTGNPVILLVSTGVNFRL